MELREITRFLETTAPLSLQESYDNSGLSVGRADKQVKGILICLDVTEEVIDEAIEKNADLIISHHPVIFGGLKKLNESNMVERIVAKAIKNDIALYAIHTNLDSVHNGVSGMIAKKLELRDVQVLSPSKNLLRKLVTFCPDAHVERVRQAIFEAGAGNIGNYSNCSFNAKGTGTFQGGENTNPYVGKQNSMHYENETRIETIYPVYNEGAILKALTNAHPYEEVAYDIFPLQNKYHRVGMGAIGHLEKAMQEEEFLVWMKEKMKTKCVRHTPLTGKKIKKVALCGGSGSFLINDALRANADVFISGDIKYHDFFRAENKLIIADIGHYESEQFTKELLFNLLNEKFTNFAISISDINTNPIQYL